MKATDLMIGDYVEITGKGACRVKHINWPSQHEEMDAKMHPIPLTPEILEKNGMETKDGDEFILFDNSKIDTTGEYVIIRYYAKVCRLWICKGNVVENEIHIDCQYVHELQHALKLCGIDKEIVL